MTTDAGHPAVRLAPAGRVDGRTDDGEFGEPVDRSPDPTDHTVGPEAGCGPVILGRPGAGPITARSEPSAGVGPTDDTGPGRAVPLRPPTHPGPPARAADPVRAPYPVDRGAGRPVDGADPSERRTPRSGGRHAHRGGPADPVRRARLDYTPRHYRPAEQAGPHRNGAGPANREPPDGPDRTGLPPGSADRTGLPTELTELTEVFSRVRRDPTEPPRADRPEPAPSVAPAPVRPASTAPTDREEIPTPPGKRVRVVLAQSKGRARPVSTMVDVRELTQVGEVLATSLIRSQLGLALRIGCVALLVLGTLPVIFAVFPVLGRVEVIGLRLPWLVLGILAYPFLLLLGWIYARAADRLEQAFADHIKD